jgi:Tfp pilus assembly protein PilN
MSKLYISYYGEYISIVEGSYNKNKKKYNIKNSLFIPLVEESYNEYEKKQKYDNLRRALQVGNFKSKNVVLCLSTKDVIIKSINIPKVDPKDLDSIISMEMEDFISLDKDQYEISYTVIKEIEEDENKLIEVMVAAAPKEQVDNIVNILKNLNLNVESIDIIANSYIRILQQVEYTDMMIVNSGPYGTIIGIYKEDSLFINDFVPIKIDDNFSYFEALSMVEEAKGLMNYYSSRNFGKVVDNILLLGQAAYNNDTIKAFKESFKGEVMSGIDELFDIKEEINKIDKIENTSLFVENLGLMLRDLTKKLYNKINLVPDDIKKSQKHKKNIIIATALLPIVLGIFLAPYIIMNNLNKSNEENLLALREDLNSYKEQAKETDNIKKNIKLKKEEIEQYDMLLENQISWGDLVSYIDKNIPYRVELTNLSFSYGANVSKVQDEENKTEEKKEQTKDDSKTTEQPIYKMIPNVVNIEGRSRTPDLVGQFVYILNKNEDFKSVDLKSVTKDENSGYKFIIKAYIKEGAIIIE